jgi:hypothetical protein
MWGLIRLLTGKFQPATLGKLDAVGRVFDDCLDVSGMAAEMFDQLADASTFLRQVSPDGPSRYLIRGHTEKCRTRRRKTFKGISGGDQCECFCPEVFNDLDVVHERVPILLGSVADIKTFCWGCWKFCRVCTLHTASLHFYSCCLKAPYPHSRMPLLLETGVECENSQKLAGVANKTPPRPKVGEAPTIQQVSAEGRCSRVSAASQLSRHRGSSLGAS